MYCGSSNKYALLSSFFVLYDNLNHTIMHFAWCLLLICQKTDICMMLQLKTFCFFTILNKNRLYVAVHLYSNRSQMTPKCSKNINDSHSCALCATLHSYHILISFVN